DRFDAAGTRARGAVERAVADLELYDVLAFRLQRLRDTEHGERGFDGERASEFAELYGHVTPSSCGRCGRLLAPSERRSGSALEPELGAKESFGLGRHVELRHRRVLRRPRGDAPVDDPNLLVGQWGL